jgi:hypothetical protein
MLTNKKLLRALLILAFMRPPACVAENGVQATNEDQGIRFREAGKGILFFQLKPKSQEGQHQRNNYIHPLYDLDGNILTEDFPADHSHHRGIFWAWHQIQIDGRNIADSWTCENFACDIVSTRISEQEDSSATLRLKALWKCRLHGTSDQHAAESSIVEETTTLRVYPAANDQRKLDFEIRLLALTEGVSIGGSDDEKEYGGFSARLRLPQDIQFRGIYGSLEPQITCVDAGPAVGLTGSFGAGGQNSVAILRRPSPPQVPQKWVLRREKSMQNPIFPGRTPVDISPSQPTVLRYRIVLQRDTVNGDSLKQLLESYSAEVSL